MKVRRYIGIYDDESEDFIGEIPLIKDDLEILQKIFGEPPSEPMYDCWDVNHDKAEQLYLKGMIQDRLELGKSRVYFLEASQA